MDKEVHRDVWEGRLPLCFNLNQDDVTSMQRPEPYFMMAPRVTYFPLILDRVVKYFNQFVDQVENKTLINDMWLDYNGQPIKLQYPIGLSWDLFGLNTHDLPWRLILHISDFPSSELIRCNTKQAIETNFISCIKEADSLKHKSSVMKSFGKKEQNQLWLSLVGDKFETFWHINKKLMERAETEYFKSIPFRLYFPDYTYIQKIVKPSTDQQQIFFNSEHVNSNTSHHIPRSGDNSRFSTMLDLIQVTFVNRLDDLLLVSSSENDRGHSQGPESPIDTKRFKYRFVVHGVEVPFHTPLQWLSENFSYPDNFLHISAVPK